MRTSRALLADPAVDVVGVCVPPAEHAAVGGCRAGRRPPCARGEADRRVARGRRRARRRGGGLGRSSPRWGSTCAGTARSWRPAKHCGGATSAACTSCARSGRPAREPSRRRAPGGASASRAGGVLFELGSHHVDLWRHLLGDEIVACAAVAGFSGGVEEDAVVTARSRAGVLVTSTFSQASSDSNELELVGEGGRLHLGLFRGDGPSLHPLGREGGGGPGARRRGRAVAGGPAAPGAGGAARRGLPHVVRHGVGAPLERAVRRRAASPCRRCTTGARPCASCWPPASWRRRRERPARPLRGADDARELGARSGARCAPWRRRRSPAGSSWSSCACADGPLGDAPPELSRLAAVEVVSLPGGRTVAEGNAAGVRRARAPVVVFAEDHSFPLPGWAAALVERHDGRGPPWARSCATPTRGRR